MPYGKFGRAGNGGGLTSVSRGRPKTTVTKDVTYLASGTNSNQIVALAGTDSATVTTADAPRAITIQNVGRFPVVTMLGYQQFSDEDTEENTVFMHTLLLPGERITPNMRGFISTQGSNVDHTNASFADRSLWNLDGEVVDFTVPNVNLKIDAGDNVASGELANTTDPVVFELDNGHEKYRVGDYLRVENEIIKVEGTYDDNPTSSTVADNHIVVSRGHFGSTTASHSGTPDVELPIFNQWYDFDRPLSGSSQLVQTDSLGRYTNTNFFGYGRVNSATAPFGLVPGSICIRFYSQAYQEITMGGTGVAGGTGVSNLPITSSTSSRLTVSTEYSFNLTIDDSSATTVSFTTDSSNVNFGGTNGVISKIQDAMNTATRTVANNLYGYSCTVSIVRGALRFTSASHLIPHDGTNGSKILIEDGAGGTNVFTGADGIFPDITQANAPVKPKLPDLNVYDTTTYAKSPNIQGICYDNSKNTLIGAAKGTINYETGAISITDAPVNACFEVSVIHNSPFSGKLDANKSDTNTLKSVHANVLNRNMSGKLKVTTY